MRVTKPVVAVLSFFLASPAALSKSVPDLSGLDPETRELVENACYTEKHRGGPTAYADCIRKQLAELESSGGVPDLSSLGPQTRELIENACVTEKFRGGPAAYAACVETQLSEFKSSGGVPDLSGLDPETREPIEDACVTERYRGGPAAYADCLGEQLAKIGMEPERMPRERYAPIETKPRHAPDRRSPGEGVQPRGPERRVEPNVQVQSAQAILQSLGYDPGPVDGQMGPRTREAIMAFQRDHGLQADGQLNIFLLIVMEAERLRRQDPSLAGARGPNVAAIPPTDWPAWQRVSDLMPSAYIGPKFGPADLFEAVKKSVWVVVAGRSKEELEHGGDLSQGSAVVVSRKRLLTNCHVVEGRASIVIVQDTEMKDARLAAADPATDRCILSVAEPTLKPVRGIRRFAHVRVGERVFTVGAPIGLQQTLGEGIISGLRDSDFGQVVQTTAQMSPGSSGGGLFDGSGNLIGITTFGLTEGQSINFAIAAEEYWR